MPRDRVQPSAGVAGLAKAGRSRARALVVRLPVTWQGGPLAPDEPAEVSWLEEWPGGGEGAPSLALPVFGRDVRGFRHVFCNGRASTVDDVPPAWGVSILVCDSCDMLAIRPADGSDLELPTLFFRHQDLDLVAMSQGGPDDYVTSHRP